jgi:hypothetical protein
MNNKPFSLSGGFIGFLFFFVVTIWPLGTLLQQIMEKVLVGISGNEICVYSGSGPEFYCKEGFQFLLIIFLLIIINSLFGIASGFIVGGFKNRGKRSI